MVKTLSILLLMLASLHCFGQQVQVVSADDLNQRINAQNDTTYVINFWATWCKPCIKELPAFEKFSQTLKGKKTKIILVSLDFETDLQTQVLPFIKQHKIASEVVLLSDKDPQQFINKIDTGWRGSVPATLFVKHQQRIFFERVFTYDELLKTYASIN